MNVRRGNGLPYGHDVDAVLRLVGERALARALDRTERALDDLRAMHARRPLALLRVPFRHDDVAELEAVAERFAGDAGHIVHFGTGGSSLGAQALAEVGHLLTGCARVRQKRPPVYLFMDNLESPWMERALQKVDLRHARFLVVSKSGGTPETVAQALMAIELLRVAGAEEEIPERLLFLTDPPRRGRDNVLRRVAADYGVPVLDHEPDIGGRYSVLTNVGMLPAAMFGLDVTEIRSGAAEVLEPVLRGDPVDELPPAIGAALHYALMEAFGIGIVVTMPYTSRLRLFGAWLQQLWAESLGKEGKGTQPVTAIGPVDQHSQLQLYLDGPNDKLFNIIQIECVQESFRLPERYRRYTDLAGFRIADLTHAQQRATTETLIRRGRPVRVFRLRGLNERTMGALFMHFMLETVLLGRMLGVNPFDQPAVEESKRLTRSYLLGARETVG